jgi:hypothetical protein
VSSRNDNTARREICARFLILSECAREHSDPIAVIMLRTAAETIHRTRTKMIAGYEKYDLEIAPRKRTCCMKCGDKLNGDATGDKAWCPTCRYLLRRPEPPFSRYSVKPPDLATLLRLGLRLTFDEKQAEEIIPSGRHVEHWYDPEKSEEAFDALFRRALTPAA